MSTPERITLWRFSANMPGGGPSKWFHADTEVERQAVEPRERLDVEDFLSVAVHEAALVEARTQEREKISDELHGDEAEAIRVAAIRDDIPPEDALAEWVRSGGPE